LRSDEELLAAITQVASAASGVDFSRYRAATVERRVALRLTHTRQPDLSAYLALLAADPAEAHQLAEQLLVNTTEAFRDRPVFEGLVNALLPPLVAERARAGARRLRIWSAGTSMGDEAYSLGAAAIAVAGDRLEIDVLATDVSSVALERAARGAFPRSRLTWQPLGTEHLFTIEGERVEVGPTLRSLVTFARHDLLDRHRIAPREAVIASFDVVACRNVLIYLQPDAVTEVTSRLLKVLNPGGLLVLGTAEQLPRELLDQVTRPITSLPIYRRI
jgi:chemotaxis methyl-accepting protein methylase